MIWMWGMFGSVHHQDDALRKDVCPELRLGGVRRGWRFLDLFVPHDAAVAPGGDDALPQIRVQLAGALDEGVHPDGAHREILVDDATEVFCASEDDLRRLAV